MSDWPIYFKDQLILGNPKSEIGLITLWTPKEAIAKGVGQDNFAACGQLYSKEGINYLLRNIFANPKIRHLVICGEDRSKSGEALISLLENGVDGENCIIGSKFAQINKEIPSDRLGLFRKSVTFLNLAGEYNTEKIMSGIKSYSAKGSLWAKPETFPENKVEFEGALPSEGSVYLARGKYAGEVWLEIMKKVMKFGSVRKSRYGNNCREIFNVAAVVTEEDPINPKLFPYFQITINDIESYIPKIMSGERGTAEYTYGERLWNFPQNGLPQKNEEGNRHNQISHSIISRLEACPTDRTACATVFGVNDPSSKSPPCMAFLQATIANDKLQLTAYFRSHDIFGGWLLNAFGLRMLQKHIADCLKKSLGNLTIYSNCAHIYDTNWADAQKLIRKYGGTPACSPDPRGYISLSADDRDIVLRHISPQGLQIQELRQNGLEEGASRKLRDEIIARDIISQVSHGIYLGEEIQKAQLAIKKGLSYTQDLPLDF
jgi:thymidylate synthase